MLISGIEVDTVFIQQILDQVTYKPGWHFGLDMREGPTLYLYAYVNEDLDSRTNEVRVMYETSKRWPMNWPPQSLPITREHILAWVRHAIQEWEIHESNEWLRINYELVHNPHVCRQCLIGGCRA